MLNRSLFVYHRSCRSAAETLNTFTVTTRYKSSTCPITGTNQTVSSGDNSNSNTVKLQNIPKLPLLGSFVPQHSGVDKFDLSKTYDWWLSNNKKFGNFYSIGFVGMGKGLLGTTYVLTDPDEYMKVLRKEGQHPFGAVMTEWPIIKYYKDGGTKPGCSAGYALFATQGEEWKRIRRFMQTDLLSPDAAKGYLPAMIKACEVASRGAPSHTKNINDYTAQCSFDMFSGLVFGEFPGLAGDGDKKDEQDVTFCKSSVTAIELIVPMLVDPSERILNMLGIKSKSYSTFLENFNIARNIALEKVERFKERKANGELNTHFEKQSYASLAIDRYMNSLGEEGALKEDEVGELFIVALIAALDTTSAMLNWCIIHLAQNPNVQRELYEEVSSNVIEDGHLSVDYFTSKTDSAYLNAVLRENHRISPPIALNLVKENVTDEIELHGETIPKQSLVICDTRSVGMDEGIVPNPDVFDPTRWLDKDKIKRRKGTPAQVLDHPLYREPFSAGARKCPGSRVANYEVKTMLSQLVLDWKISMKDDGKSKSWRDIAYFNGLTVQPTVPELVFEKRT